MFKLSFLPFKPQFKRPVVDGWMWAEGATPIWKFTSFLKANSHSSIEPIAFKSNLKNKLKLPGILYSL